MSRRTVVLRGFGVLVALGLAAAGAWLLVTSNQVRWVRIGALAELWAILIGAFALFGARRHHASVAGTEPVAAADADDSTADDDATAASEIAVEDAPEPEPDEEIAYDRRMEDILRREIRTVLTRELTLLRAQVATLRSDVLERVTPDSAPAVAADLQIFGRRLAALSQHEIRPAGEPADVELPLEPVPAPEGAPEAEQEAERAHDLTPEPVREPTFEVEPAAEAAPEAVLEPTLEVGPEPIAEAESDPTGEGGPAPAFKAERLPAAAPVDHHAPRSTVARPPARRRSLFGRRARH